MQKKPSDDTQVVLSVQPLRIINVIEERLVIDRPSKNQLHAEYRRVLQLQQQRVDPLVLRSVNMVNSLISLSGTRPISFDDDEIVKVQSPRLDPLVISIWICNS